MLCYILVEEKKKSDSEFLSYNISIKLHPIPSTLNFSRFFVATAAILKFLSLKIMCTHVRQNFWKVSSNSEHHSKLTMNINLHHHNLLGNQISPKSEDFCIWWPFYTLVTMATVTILNFFSTPKSCHILQWIFLQSGT